MGRFLALVILVMLPPWVPAFAGEAPGEDLQSQLAKLDGARVYYELMLRDAKTETAAKYFIARLNAVRKDHAALAETLAALPPQASPAPAPALTQRVVTWLRARIHEKVSEKGSALSGVAAWIRRELPDELMSSSDEWLGGKGPHSREVAAKAWGGRARHVWRSASYGSGSFLVVPMKVGPPPKKRKGRKPSGAAPAPKPPTRDQWWATASAAERTAWIFAFFVENAGLFEVSGERIVTSSGPKFEVAVRYR